MMVLAAVAIGAGWLGQRLRDAHWRRRGVDEAAAALAAFVLLGHWFEMRARGVPMTRSGTLLELAPPMAAAIRDGEPVEVPTAEVKVDDLLLIRPGAKIPVDGTVIEGESEIDESMVTGEICRWARQSLTGHGASVTPPTRCGCADQSGPTRTGHIVALEQQVQNSKARRPAAADRAAFWLVLVALPRWHCYISGSACRRPAQSPRRYCSRSQRGDRPAPTRWAWQLQQRRWSGTGMGADEVRCSRTKPLWRPRPDIDTVVMDMT